ncbi:MAG: antibiotic biosynthesis monooxygenase [Oleiphilaceae bacterium]|nr:antibiotic biosynthesis monooxygenase [Oleiphilaceae bacterium]
MYSVAFIFTPGNYDAEFHALDQCIAEVAESMPGFVGKEVWHAAEGRQINSTYYWKDEDSLQAFSRHPKHQEAKRQYRKWYEGYHIVIAKIERSYGDGRISHITPNARATDK